MRPAAIIGMLTALWCVAAIAQIPNASFENWTLGEPDGWATSNAAPAYVNVTQSTSARTGTSAVRGEVVNIPGGVIPIQPIIQSGVEGEGFPISYRPASITGWYQFSPVSGDRFGVNVTLFKGGIAGTAVAVAASADPTARGTYTQFNVPFLYLTGDVPDTCVIQHQIIGPTTGTTWHQGSWFLLDDLAFSGVNDVMEHEAVPAAFTLDQNYPNPFNPVTRIRYGIAGGGDGMSPVDVRLAVYDLLGREVALVVDHVHAPGTYDVAFDAAGLASGVYLYRLQAGNVLMTRTMTVLR